MIFFNQTLENIKIIDYYFLVPQKYVNNTLLPLYVYMQQIENEVFGLDMLNVSLYMYSNSFWF